MARFQRVWQHRPAARLHVADAADGERRSDVLYSPTTHILASFHTAITGITQGLGASNPGSTDLSASFPNNTNGQPTIYEEWASGNFDLAQRTFELIPVGGGWLALDRPNCPFVLATAQPFGVGCPPLTGNPNAEFYELFSTGPAFDLSNRGIDLIPIGSGYLVVPSATAWFFGFANATALGDDQTSQVTLPFSFPTPAGTFSSFGVSSNGYLQFSNSLTATPYPGPLEFQNEEPRIYGLWTDLDPASCGQTYSDAISPTSWAFTWNGVAEYPSASPAATFQVQVRSDGTVSILWQSVQVISHPIMVGFSRGFGVADPFNQDLCDHAVPDGPRHATAPARKPHNANPRHHAFTAIAAATCERHRSSADPWLPKSPCRSRGWA